MVYPGVAIEIDCKSYNLPQLMDQRSQSISSYSYVVEFCQIKAMIEIYNSHGGHFVSCQHKLVT